MTVIERAVVLKCTLNDPTATFVGAFNSGKSSLINALVRWPVLPTAREQTTAVNTCVIRTSIDEGVSYAGVSVNGEGIIYHSREEFLNFRCGANFAEKYVALAAFTPSSPFSSMVLVDTQGIGALDLPTLPQGHEWLDPNNMLVVVVHVEEWQSKPNMDMVRRLANADRRILIVANHGDRLNPSDIIRIRSRAPKVMLDYEINPPPPFLVLSARLELERRVRIDGYREETKRSVAQLCDAAFDTFRVMLHEFEAAQVFARTHNWTEQQLHLLARCLFER